MRPRNVFHIFSTTVQRWLEQIVRNEVARVLAEKLSESRRFTFFSQCKSYLFERRIWVDLAPAKGDSNEPLNDRCASHPTH
jgi:hypothetical protein